MALTPKAATPSTSRVQTQARTAENGRENAAAFINFNFPTRDGETKRLDSMALMASNPLHAQIMAFLEDPETREANLQSLLARLVADYRVVRTGPGAELDL